MKEQTSKDFVWLVVSDGSTDDTDSTMTELVSHTTMPVRYISKPNGGKHTALEMGMNETQTPYFLDCDDDDLYEPTMIEVFLRTWDGINREKRDDIGAVRALTKYADGRIVCGYNFDMADIGKQFDATTLEMNYIRNLRQENITCYSIKALRSVDLFPKEFWLSDKVTFISEGIWQGRFARRYKCRYIYEILREYNVNTESITRCRFSRQKALNGFLNRHMALNEHYDLVSHDKPMLIKKIASMGALRAHTPVNVFQHLQHCRPLLVKVLVLLTSPATYILGLLKYRILS